MDGTLSDRLGAAYDMYDWCVSQMGDLPPLEKERVVQDLMLWDQFGFVNKKEVWQKLKDKYLPDLVVDEWTKRWYGNFFRFQRLRQDCADVLSDLRKDYKLGIVTNGSADSQMAKVKALGLDQMVDCVVTEGDLGFGKPDPRVFVYAADRLCLPCDEICFVGDTFSTDIYGALKAGMKALWLCLEHQGVSRYNVKQISGLNDIRGVIEREWR